MQGKLVSEPLTAFQTLMKFIQKSVLVNNSSLLDGELVRGSALNLKKALDAGDAAHSIFDDQNCQLYLIYLLKENLISDEQFLTGYLYLSVLIQFTEKQLIHPEHIEARRLDWGDVRVFNSTDTTLLVQYANQIQESFQNNILAEDIIDYFSSVSDSEGWIIGMPYKNMGREDDVAKMMGTNIRFSPVLQVHPAHNQNYVLIPSIGFSKWLLHKLNPERQIEMAPCFGNIGTKILYDYFHSQNKHPITIHSAYIKSNPKRIHEAQAGPVPFALHDIFFHCYGATAFKQNEFDFLMHVFIPALQKIIDSEASPVKEMAKKMQDIINDLAFNPQNLISKNNLQNYLRSKLDSSSYGSNEWGQLNEDELLTYFILLQRLCEELINQKDMDLSPLLHQVINMKFINDIEFDPAISRQEALNSVVNQIKSMAMESLSTQEISDQLSVYSITYPEVGLMINRAGYKFLPPLHSFPESLLQEALQQIQSEKINHTKVCVGDNPSAMFSRHSTIDVEHSDIKTEEKKM